jgi:hypothetical protein
LHPGAQLEEGKEVPQIQRPFRHTGKPHQEVLQERLQAAKGASYSGFQLSEKT